MNSRTENKVKDVAISNPAARQAVEDPGVHNCCGEGKSVHEACLHSDVSAEQILARLRENGKNVNPGAKDFATAPLNELTRYIREKHHSYVREAITRIQSLLIKVTAVYAKNHIELAAIHNHFSEVAREMIQHMQKEEMILFPYIDALEKAANGNGALETPFFQTVRNPIHAMMKDHDAAEDRMKQIRKASSDYTAPGNACTSYKALYQELNAFEADLHQHVHLENNILFPRAVELEAAAN